MTLRAALLLLLVGLLPGCVTTGKVNPMDTQKGRNEARDAYVQLGLGYLMQGDTERAKVPLKSALDLDSSSQDANAALALVFQAEREPKLAEEYFRKSLSSGENARIRNNYGSFLFEQQRYPEAYEMFQKAASDPLYPERSRVFENLGMAAQQLNRPDEAQGWLEKAIAMNGRQPRALLELAEIAYDRKQFVPSRDYFQRFSQLSEQNARSLLLGIRLAKVFEDKNTAASYGLQLKRLYPGTPEYQQYLSEH
ncbi:type IV pilus biogenesis/stability protein PilW [Pseudomonas sp. KNUC1026]|uniref:type IV pilus biogenesis/stability protein PilW n=1 Tax=Pseudomonas sp. KNUC1026 TaxID=2893890 RepID=UPI001F20E83F|nr:type IV pilus biogenesis/stability protein PilW [Pseudomonas sp. KNUC1026]UFH50088.1 type IV pilus biogenesis/stability protein PilW [Pseudomonas sp. KNUC1026]